ncbi:MAG: GNAT family N-acetyltransferase [candidate division KSB1 bacterium]|nr:GNAT family N-acetyltransferase [candidate division KSB1 bacterium]MDZ7318693.1 GNAT family N-acetyltransferase [candidate division KSB1 bacterium]MDZ7342187.1 GNAT family N-acetyltransferase [candidate division KSB1 bacterium]
MKIIDLSPEHESLYYLCLEDWSDEIKAAGNHKACWYAQMKDKGLRVKLAVADSGQIGGMIQYLPIEHSMATGDKLFFILCIWVHGYRQGRGNFQKKGMGRALLQAAEADAAALGAKGMAAWGISLPFWMRASWFKKQGYQRADKQGLSVLLWKPFVADTAAPQWIKQKKWPEKIPGQVTVTSFIDGWCPAQNLVHERARLAAQALGEKVVFKSVHTSSRDVFLEWGIADGLYIDDRPLRTGPPPSLARIQRRIAKKLKRLS